MVVFRIVCFYEDIYYTELDLQRKYRVSNKILVPEFYSVIDGHHRFPNNILIWTNTSHELQQMLQELPDESENQGLKTNKSKTKVMMENDTPIYIYIYIYIYICVCVCVCVCMYQCVVFHHHHHNI